MYDNMNRSKVTDYMNMSSMMKKKRKVAPAGALNAKTLAEENLRGFKLRNMKQENDISLRTNCP